MKKILKVVFVLLLLAVAGAAIFIATFDADRYRPTLIHRMESALGRPVQLQRISLGWRGGISLELQGLEIKPAVRVEKAGALLRLRPLLKGDLQLGSVVVTGLNAKIVRSSNGAIELEGTPPPPTQASTAPAPASHPAPAVKAAPLLIQRIQVTQGTLSFTDLSAQPPIHLTVEDLELEASLHGDQLDLKKLTCRFIQAGQPALQGRLSASFNGTFQQALVGQGRIHVEDARLEGINLLREVFSRLTVISGLTETLMSQLPESYAEKFNAKDTLFQPIDLQVKTDPQEISFENVRLGTDTFQLGGSGRFGLKGTLQFPAQIQVEPQLSAALIRSVKELKFLADEQGRLTFPILLQGDLPQVSVLPDLNYLTQRLVSSKGEELIGSLLDRVLKKD